MLRQTQVILAIGAISLAGATFSAGDGLVSAITFVSTGKERAATQLPAPIAGALAFTAADSGFGFFAPQVCSEFRLIARVQTKEGGKPETLTLAASAESKMLVSSFSSQAQDDGPSRTLATTFASWAMSTRPKTRYVQVLVQAEDMPPLSQASHQSSTWKTLRTYYFAR